MARDELITFERRVTTPDGMGGGTIAWTAIGQAWAAVQWVGGGESDKLGAVRATSRYRFTLPAAAADEIGITTSDRVRWGAETYDIRERPRHLRGTADCTLFAETGTET